MSGNKYKVKDIYQKLDEDCKKAVSQTAVRPKQKPKCDDKDAAEMALLALVGQVVEFTKDGVTFYYKLIKIDGDACLFDDNFNHVFAVKIKNIKSFKKYIRQPLTDAEIAPLIGKICYFEVTGCYNDVARLVKVDGNSLTFIQKCGIHVTVKVANVNKLGLFQSRKFAQKDAEL